jgi:hypothetical protein
MLILKYYTKFSKLKYTVEQSNLERKLQVKTKHILYRMEYSVRVTSHEILRSSF